MENDESLNIQNKTNINCCGFNKDPQKSQRETNIFLNSDTCNSSVVCVFNCFQLLKLILMSIDTFFYYLSAIFKSLKYKQIKLSVFYNI